MTNGDYTQSAAYKLNPTHCSCCNRPLVDGTSVEFGIGPVCRGKYGYEDAYEIDDETAQKVTAILQNLSDTALADKAMNAVLKDDSRKAVNVLNHAVAFWAHEGTHLEDTTMCLEAMKAMGYETLSDKIGGRLAEVEITVEDGMVLLDTPFDTDFIEAIKSVTGRRWDKENKVWKVPVSQKSEAWEALKSAYAGKLGHGPKGMFRI
jgi:hypothetical protein